MSNSCSRYRLESLGLSLYGSGAYSRAENTDRASITALINQLSEVLQTVQQDPTPVVKLISIIIRPKSFTFQDVLSIQPSVDFVAGFTSPMFIINLLTLDLLAKAAYTASEAAIVAGQPGVMMALVQLWLRTPDTAVARRALEVIWDLMKVDHQHQNAGHLGINSNSTGSNGRGDGQGLVWRRLFGDRDIYEEILSICSLSTVGQANQPGKRHKTVAQARVMDFIPGVAKLDWEIVSLTRFPDIDSRFGVKDGGLVEFAALHMVDVADDLLMHVTLIDFLTELLGVYSCNELPLSTSRSPLLPLSGSSPTLDFLIKYGLHQRTASYYLDPSKHDSTEIAYIYSKAANYLAIYATCYPNHLLRSSPPTAEYLLRRISQALNISPGQWIRGTDVQHDLHVLASLPRVILIPSPSNATSPILKVPVKPANPAALRTLATIFHGPVSFEPDDRATGLPPNALADMEEPTSLHGEAAAARFLYFYYLEHHPNFWSQVITAAEVIALKENALAAISLLSAVMTAVWAPLPTQPASNATGEGPVAETTHNTLLPAQRQAEDLLGAPAETLSPSGIFAILSPPTVDVVLPYLLRPAQTFSNLVGGRGDVESSAYRIATAKYDLLTLFYRQLKSGLGSVVGLEEIEAAVKRRLAEGPLAGSSDVGARIGTLEL